MNRILPLLVFVIIGMLILPSCKSDSAQKSNATGDAQIDGLTSKINGDPNNADLYYLRAKAYYDKAGYDKAILDLKHALSIDSLNPDYYHLLSDSYLDYYNSKEAMGTMLKVLTLYPERVPSLLKMAELKYILEDYDGSILTINEVVRLDPQNAEGYFMLGMNMKAINETERAINAYQTAVEMDSKLTDAWISLGELYENKKDPKALDYYESAIISNPNSKEALHAKAFYLQNHGKIKDAKQIYRDIIMMDKNYSDAYLNLGLLYLDQDSITLAFEQFDIMAGVNPTNYMGFYMRGVANEKKGDKVAALKDYESAYHLNNQDKRVSDALSALKNQIN